MAEQSNHRRNRLGSQPQRYETTHTANHYARGTNQYETRGRYQYDAGGTDKRTFLISNLQSLQMASYENDIDDDVEEMQVVSASAQEERNPMIISQINTFRTTYDKLALLRMRNAVSELKQAQMDLAELVELERDKMVDFIHIQAQSLQLLSNSRLQDLQWENRELFLKLDQMEANYIRTKEELQHIKLAIDSEQPQQHPGQLVDSQWHLQAASWRNQPVAIASGNECSSCLLLKEQLKQCVAQLDNSRTDNQSLQEHIFDIEQRAAGIDLQVEKRLKDKLRMMVSNPTNQEQVVVLTQHQHRLTEEILSLKQKIATLQEDKLAYHSQLLNSQKIQQQQLQLFNQQIYEQEQMLSQAKQEVEAHKQLNYQREQQLLEAEDNLSQKIANLRLKEAEVSKWEAELTKWDAELSRKAELTHKTPIISDQRQSFGRSQPNKVLPEELIHKHSKEVSLKSFGRSPVQMLPEDDQNVVSHRSNYASHNLETYQVDNYQVPSLNERTGRWPQSRSYLDDYYISSPAHQHVLHPEGPPKQSQLASSHFNGQQDSRQKQKMSSRVGYRQGSKNSRASGRSVGSSYQRGASQGRRLWGEGGGQLNGLSGKLQKLREQIKKEIDSIK